MILCCIFLDETLVNMATFSSQCSKSFTTCIYAWIYTITTTVHKSAPGRHINQELSKQKYMQIWPREFSAFPRGRCVCQGKLMDTFTTVLGKRRIHFTKCYSFCICDSLLKLILWHFVYLIRRRTWNRGKYRSPWIVFKMFGALSVPTITCNQFPPEEQALLKCVSKYNKSHFKNWFEKKKTQKIATLLPLLECVISRHVVESIKIWVFILRRICLGKS